MFTSTTLKNYLFQMKKNIHLKHVNENMNIEFIFTLYNKKGSPGDYKSAVYTLNKFLSFGWNASLVTHEMYANYPVQRQVKLINASGDVYVFHSFYTISHFTQKTMHSFSYCYY